MYLEGRVTDKERGSDGQRGRERFSVCWFTPRNWASQKLGSSSLWQKLSIQNEASTHRRLWCLRQWLHPLHHSSSLRCTFYFFFFKQNRKSTESLTMGEHKVTWLMQKETQTLWNSKAWGIWNLMHDISGGE